MASRSLVASLTLAAQLATCASLAAGQIGADPSRRRAGVASPAVVLEHIQSRLMTLDDGGEEEEARVEGLASALLAASIRSSDAPRIRTLARDLVAALAPGFVDEDHAERLAQDLFAVLSAPRLSPREAALLVEDVTVLMRLAGVAPVSGERVLRGVGDLCGITAPDAALPPTSARGPQLLSRP